MKAKALKSLLIEASRRTLRFLVRTNSQLILLPLYTFILRERCEDGSNCRLKETESGARVSILALNSDLFRGDLEVLASRPEFRILNFNVGWQRVIVHAFYPLNADALHYYHPGSGTVYSKGQESCRRFLRAFLKKLYQRIRVDCIVVPNVRFIEDLDWCYVSRELGIPVVLMFREGLMMFERGYTGTLGRHQKFGRFQGDHIIVHNEISKKMFVDSGFARPDQVSVNGVLRMDGFIKRILNNYASATKRKSVVLFYFPYDVNNEATLTSTGLSPPGVPFALYKDLHLSLVALATAHPEIDFVIKPKPKDYDSGQLQSLYREYGIEAERIPNLFVRPHVNVHELIFDSTVFIGLQSTTILEAAIARKPVILPFFEAYRASAWSARFGYKDFMHLFDVPSDADDIKRMILIRLENPYVDESIVRERDALFERYVSSLSSDATAKYASTLKSVVSRTYA